MSDLIHTFAKLSYDKKREKVLAVLALYVSHPKMAALHATITHDNVYSELRLGEIYTTLLHYAQRKQQKMQTQQHTSSVAQKQKVHKAAEKDAHEADILLDSLLDNRCE